MLTMILLRLEPYEILIMALMISKAMRAHLSKAHWNQLLYETILDSFDSSSEMEEPRRLRRQREREEHNHDNNEDCMESFMEHARRLLTQRYVIINLPKSDEVPVKLPDRMYWDGPSHSGYELRENSMFEFIDGIPFIRPRYAWLLHSHGSVYPDYGFSAAWRSKVFHNPEKVVAAIIDIFYDGCIKDFMKDEQAVLIDQSQDPEVIDGFIIGCHAAPYNVVDPVAFGVFSLSVMSRDIIAESRGLPVPFTRQSVSTRLIERLTSGEITDLKIEDFNNADPENNYMLVQRIIIQPFTIRVPK